MHFCQQICRENVHKFTKYYKVNKSVHKITKRRKEKCKQKYTQAYQMYQNEQNCKQTYQM